MTSTPAKEAGPCPVCGESPAECAENVGGPAHRVYCETSDCWVDGPVSPTREAAIAAWNRRAPSPDQPAGEGLTVDALAQEIRRVNGSNGLGAGALAEALMPFLAAHIRALTARAEAAEEALRFYAADGLAPNDGPWGVSSNDFGTRARKVLAALRPEPNDGRAG